MAIDNEHLQFLLSKLQNLPQERILEVEDFVDFLYERAREQELTDAAAEMAEPAFARVWDNTDDAVYDKL